MLDGGGQLLSPGLEHLRVLFGRAPWLWQQYALLLAEGEWSQTCKRLGFVKRVASA